MTNKFNRTKNWVEGCVFLREDERWDNHPLKCSIWTCEWCMGFVFMGLFAFCFAAILLSVFVKNTHFILLPPALLGIFVTIVLKKASKRAQI